MRNRWIGPLLIALALNTGTLKGLRLPGPDLTVAAVVGVAVCASAAIVRDGLPKMWPKFTVAFSTAICLFYSSVGNTDSYGHNKVRGILLITLPLAALAPIVCRTAHDVVVLLYGLAALGVFASLGIMLGLEQTGTTSRVGLGEGNPLLLGRTAGLAAAALFALMLHKRISAKLFIPAAVLATYAVLDGQNRGPLLAEVFCILLFAIAVLARLLSRRARLRRWFPGPAWILLAALACLPALTALRSLLLFGTGRITSYLEEEEFLKSTARQTAFHDAIQAFSRQPLGRGWGSFYTVSIDQLTYPHNLLLEVAVEAGLLPALALLAWILHVLSTVLDRQAADSSLLALPFIFLLANAMWSGDINGNRGLLTIGMIALSMRTHPRSSVASFGAPREHSRRLISKKSAPPFARPLRTIVRREIEAG